MRIEMPWAIVGLLQQPHQEKQILDRLGSKPQILIEARTFLIVEIDVKEFACLNCLGHYVIEVEP